MIVGAGFAGAAAAYALTRAGDLDVVVLETEAVAGVHASGRNAALAYSFILEPQVRALARRGRAFLASPPADFPALLDNRWVGSVTLVEGAGAEEYAAHADALRAESIPLDRWSAARTVERLPLLGDLNEGFGYFCPEDGVIDIDGLLQGYLRAARRGGAKICFRTRAEALDVAGDRVLGLQTSAGFIRAPRVLLAGGPWANELAVAAGLAPLPLRPCRRHLAVVAGKELTIDPDWPFAWHPGKGFYFRPESGGLLVCACDVEELPPGDVGPDQEAVSALAERALELLPGVAGGHIRRAWAGLRTLTPDDQFVVGPDPRLEGLFWVAGLGGHGMTTSPAVGELINELVRGTETRWIDPAALSPARFWE